MAICQMTSEEVAGIGASLDGLADGCRIVVAMSGGVDSSVVAAVLKRRGYDVVGVTLQLYDHGVTSGRKGACCAGRDIHDARRVADAIGIPHYVLDYEERFRKAVIAPFADSYLAGETPIPCISCNRSVKFGDLAQMARELGAAALATGHYVGWRREADGPTLYRAADGERDQSYFLFSTPAADLEFLRFPLGSARKPEIRREASALGLAVADKPDSQDICFVPSGRYTDVIERLKPGAAEPGDIVHVDGRHLGTHPGIVHFTIGQRRGLGVTAGEPLYVVALDPQTRRVLVGPRECLLTRRLRLRDVNWLGAEPLDDFVRSGGHIQARVRSSQSPRSAILSTDGAYIEVCLAEGEYGVARGQACVFYSDASPSARLLGGGWIAEASSLGVSIAASGAGESRRWNVAAAP